MQPEIHLGPITLQTFGIMFALGFAAAGAVLVRRLKEIGKPADERDDDHLPGPVGGLVGSRLDFIIENYGDVNHDLLGNLFSGAGLVWYGGAIGGAIGVGLWAWRRKMLNLTLLDICAVPLAIGYAIGRIGCQISGDGDYGEAWDGPWAMAYPDGTEPIDTPVHPTPIYETLAMGYGALLLWRWRDRFQPGVLFAIYLLYAGVERFIVEFIRRNDTVVAGLTQAQLLSIVMPAAAGSSRCPPSTDLQIRRRSMARGPLHGACTSPRVGRSPVGASRQARADGYPTPGRSKPLHRPQHPAVQRDHGAGQVAGALGAQERDQVAVLLRRSEPACRHVLARPLPRRVERAGVVGHALGREATGGDGVDGDPVAGDFIRERLEQPDRRHSVRVRERKPRDRLPDLARADVHDPPPASLAHRRQDRVDQDAGREHERPVRGLPRLELVVERSAERRAAGVRHQDLDGAERLADLAGKRGEAVEVVGVGHERLRLATDLAGRPRDARLRARRERYSRALAGERLGDPPSDPRARAHHQRGPSLDAEVHARNLVDGAG